MPADEKPSDTRNALKAYVQPMQEAIVGESEKGLWLLLASVIGLMLIACVNLANAQFGRAIAREREAAVRSALGANQWQLLWSSLAENLLLAIAGGATGIWLASVAVNAFRRYPLIDLAPNTLAAGMRKVIWNYVPTVTIARVKSLDAQLRDSLASERFHTFVLVAFGIAALLLAMLGIYGVLSYAVASRKQEIGVRMALGATRQHIYALTMSEATIPVAHSFTG